MQYLFIHCCTNIYTSYYLFYVSRVSGAAIKCPWRPRKASGSGSGLTRETIAEEKSIIIWQFSRQTRCEIFPFSIGFFPQLKENYPNPPSSPLMQI